MPHTRRDDQTIEAFSASKDLLKRAKTRAAELGMTKSGFFRYCVAKELGMTEAQARDLAQHGSVRHLQESLRTERPAKTTRTAQTKPAPIVAEASSKPPSEEAKLAKRFGETYDRKHGKA
jgi:hypothetical protein